MAGLKRVLVVDDDDEMRRLLTTILSGAYEVSAAPDGAAGLELARRVRPDLVVLDLLMPRMHGFEVCRRLREDPELKGVKVLISSSKSYPHDVRTALEETGADGYLVKPFDVDELRGRVADLLGVPR
ncbi:MAG: response regulator [Elusimicrobia bacterium]|nr:response regulator [Elusimicrobiota bacterium]